MSACLKPIPEAEIAPLPSPVVEKKSKVSRRHNFAPLLSTLALSLLASTLLFLAIQSAEGVSTSPNLLPIAKSPLVFKKVSLRATTAQRMHGFVEVKGEVQNQTNRSLKSVEATVELLNAEGTPLHAESVLLTTPTLKAGARGSFDAVVTDVPEATSYRIQFHQTMGTMLN